jgi:hypothetical protein
MPKKLMGFKIENVGGIKLFWVEPKGDHVVIGGPNKAGKTTVIWALIGALLGAKNRKVQSLRKGAKEGKVVLDFGDLMVTWVLKDEGRDELIVSNAEGARFTSPQSMLKKLWGDRTIDPLEFFRGDATTRVETVARLAGIDIADIEQRKKKIKEERRVINRMVKKLKAQAADDAFDFPADTPDEPVDVAALTGKLRAADVTNTKNGELRKHLTEVRQQLADAKEHETSEAKRAVDVAAKADREATKVVNDAESTYQRAIKQAQEAKAEAIARSKAMRADAEARSLSIISTAKEQREKLEEREANGTKIVDELVDVDVAPLQQRMDESQATNKHVEAKLTKARLRADVDAEQARSDEMTAQLAAIEKEKLDGIASAEIPIEGLGIADGDVTLNGIASENLCSREQLEISFGLGVAAKPGIGLMLIDKWGDLDEDGRKVVVDLADEAGLQIITTVVGDKDEDITVHIRAGEIYEPPTDDESV